MSDSDLRNSVGDYTQYLKRKSMSNSSNNNNYDYTYCFNKAVKLISQGSISEGVTILDELYAVKKDPDVLRLLQENKSC